THDVPMPGPITTRICVPLAAVAKAVPRNTRRPIPHRLTAAALAEALAPTSIEHLYTQNRPALTPALDFEEPEVRVDAEWDQANGLAELFEKFEAWSWADKIRVRIEAAVETSVAGLTLRGRIDAVFRTGGDPDKEFDPDATWELVDWKTGRVPSDAEMPQRS